MRPVRRTLEQFATIAAVLLVSLAAGQAQTAAVEIDPQLREMAAMSYFLEKHVWLMDTGLIASGKNPYGISEPENAAVTATVRSLKRELDTLQEQAPNYQKENRGREYFERRKAVVMSARTRLRQAVTVLSWPKLQFHLDEIGAKLRGTPLPAPASKEPGATPSAASASSVLWSKEDLAFYSGGFAGRSDSWPEGPDAVDWCSYVNGVKGLLNNVVFDGPRSANACSAGRAWTGWISSNPSRGQYKHEGLHSYWNVRTGASAPPMPDWGPAGPCIEGWPAPYGSYCDPSNGYAAVWSPVDLTLSVSAPMEVNKPGHHVVLKNCSSPVTVAAAFTPPVPSYNTPPPITWTGAAAGSDNLHRNIQCVTPGLTSVTANVGANLSATVHVHVIDGNPPPSSSQASLNWQNIGSFTPAGAFGEAAVQIGNQGVTAPTYDVTAGFNTDRWVFRLNSVTHGFKIGLNSLQRQDLPYGNARPFPISPRLPRGTTIVQAHNAARADLDTSLVVPSGPAVGPPLMDYYWVQNVVQAHE